MAEKIEDLVSKVVIQQFTDLKAGVDGSVTALEQLIERGIQLNQVLGGKTGVKEAIKSMKELDDIEVKSSTTSKNLKVQKDELQKIEIQIQKTYEKRQALGSEQAKQLAQEKELLRQKTDELKKQTKAQNDLNKAVDNYEPAFEVKGSTDKGNNQGQAVSGSNIADAAVTNAATAAGGVNRYSEEDVVRQTKATVDLTKAQEGLKTANSEANIELQGYKLQTAEANKAAKQQAAEALGLIDAYAKLENEFKSVSREAQNLAVEFGAESDEAKAASAQALALDQRLKAADANIGKFNRNVGNYSGALKTLEKSLDSVKNRINDYTKSGNNNAAMLESLKNEEALLTQLVNSQVAGFASATAEIKSNTKALQQLEAAGLGGTAAYKELFESTAALKDETADLKAALTNAAPDDVAFNAAADSARALVGVYGLAQSATAVFGDQNEALAETMVKLQAAETALQSIEAVRAIFKKENAVFQALTIGLQKLELAGTYLQTAAESKNIIVKYAAIAAQKALNAAVTLGAGPLGIILAVVSLLVIAVSAFAASNNKATESLKRLRFELESAKEDLEGNLSAMKAVSQEQIAILQSRFATERDIRQKGLSDQKRQLDETIKTENKYKDQYNKSANAVRDYLLGTRKLTDKEYELAKNDVKKYEELNALRIDQEHDYTVSVLDEQRTGAIEAAKIRQQALQIEIDTAGTAGVFLQSITGDETKSYAARITALKKYNANRQALIELERRQQLDNPELEAPERAVINNAAQQKKIQAEKEGNDQIKALRLQEAERQRKADFDILSTRINDSIKAQETIVNNEKNGYKTQLDAAHEAYILRAGLINANLKNELKNQTLTDKERVALTRKAASELNQLTTDYGIQQLSLVKDNEAKVTAAIELEQGRRSDKAAIANNEALIALNKSFSDGDIGVKEYNKKKADIEREYSLQSLRDEVKNAFAKVVATKAGTDERLAAEKELSEATKRLSDETTAYQLANEEKLTAKKGELAQAGIDFLAAIVNGQFDAQKNEIQNQIDLSEKQKAADIDRLNTLALSEQQKADRIAIINARAQTQKEALERRQRQIDIERARFDKAVSIAQIIAKTAQAVANDLVGNKALIPFDIAIGALQLATVLATPIPRFAKGTWDAPGGASLVGDGGRSELMITPAGELIETPSIPTVMNVPKHSIILPDARAALEAGIMNQIPQGGIRDNSGAHMAALAAHLGGKMDELNNTVKNKTENHWHKEKGRWQRMTSSGGNRSRYLNENL